MSVPDNFIPESPPFFEPLMLKLVNGFLEQSDPPHKGILLRLKQKLERGNVAPYKCEAILIEFCRLYWEDEKRPQNITPDEVKELESLIKEDVQMHQDNLEESSTNMHNSDLLSIVMETYKSFDPDSDTY